MAVKKNAGARKANTSGAKKVSESKKSAAAKKTAVAKKPAAKASAKKAPAKKSVEDKSAAKKSTMKKSTAKKSSKFVSSPDNIDAPYLESSASFLSGNAKFYNRELSWLEFDDRILNEARDTKNPLLENTHWKTLHYSPSDSKNNLEYFQTFLLWQYN